MGSSNIAVVFTTLEETAAALAVARNLAREEGDRITIVAAETVPFPAQLNDPPVIPEWNERRLRAIAQGAGLETSVIVYLCRDREETLVRMMKPYSPIVIGGAGRSRWRDRGGALARKLQRAGYAVVLAPNGSTRRGR